MVIVMDMTTGEIEKIGAEEAAASEFGAFDDEVLNAGWLPQPEARLEMHAHAENSSVACAAPAIEPDEFLRNLYRNQE